MSEANRRADRARQIRLDPETDEMLLALVAREAHVEMAGPSISRTLRKMIRREYTRPQS